MRMAARFAQRDAAWRPHFWRAESGYRRMGKKRMSRETFDSETNAFDPNGLPESEMSGPIATVHEHSVEDSIRVAKVAVAHDRSRRESTVKARLLCDPDVVVQATRGVGNGI